MSDLNRRRMLKVVRDTWIDGYLKHSLDNVVRIELGLEEKPDAISRPWGAIVQHPNRAPRPLAPEQAMGDIFDELGQALLILGAPGAGKTTLLLELTRDLLDRAERDASHPMPAVFHLSSWAARRRPLADWLTDELNKRYYVPKKLAQAWVDADQILPLLDGLDEVAPEHREKCVEAINAFRQQHGLVPLAVCCRKADYDALPTRVKLSGAVAISPLLRAQVSTYLKQAGKPLAGVRAALRDDETLWEMLDTPLMLSIVALAYQGRSAAEVRATGSLEERRAHLFAKYTERMFERRTKVTDYTREQTIHWLTWLSQSLMHNTLSVFYVEWMQSNWLSSRAQSWIVAVMPIIFGGLIFGLVFRLAGLADGLIYGLVFGWVIGLAGGLDRITPAEALRWSWKRARSRCTSGLIFGLAVGLATGLAGGVIDGLAGGLIDGLVTGLVGGLVFGPAVGLVIGLIGGLVGGLSTNQIVTRTIPNEGIRRSLQNALISLLSGGLGSGLLFGLLFGLGSGLGSGLAGGLGVWLAVGLGSGLGSGLGAGLASRLVFAVVFGLAAGVVLDQLTIEQNGEPVFGLIAGVVLGLVFGLVLGLQNGGSAYLKHYVLRILLWCNDYAPWNYIRFLDHATERIFLRKVGGGYIFTHRLLMEYFASLEPTKQIEQDEAAAEMKPTGASPVA